MSTPLLSTTFERLRRAGRKALIPFITGGDPDGRTTRELLLALDDAGADIIELGIPFSDPLADGPILQAASARALHAGTTPAKVLELVASMRSRLSAPIVCLSYWNPVIQFGGHGPYRPEPFFRAAQKSGVAGLIVPDLPLEEADGFGRAGLRQGIATVLLAAPTSPAPRLRAIARASSGFIYYVSVTGTTGVRQKLPAQLVHGVRQLKLLTSKPVCVGFGISTPRQAHEVARIADGVIVGSALVQRIASAKGRTAAARAAAAFVKQLRKAV